LEWTLPGVVSKNGIIKVRIVVVVMYLNYNGLFSNEVVVAWDKSTDVPAWDYVIDLDNFPEIPAQYSEDQKEVVLGPGFLSSDKLTVGDLKKLEPGVWLNDVLINLLMG
jgi:hypothetical protein